MFKTIHNLHYEQIGKEVRCIEDELPFEIPDSWGWEQLGNIFQHNTGKALNNSNRVGELKEYITTSNLYWDMFEVSNLKKMYFKEEEIDKYTATKGDLLVCEGGDVGRAAIWNFDYNVCIQNHIHRLRAYSPICVPFFYYLIYFYKNTGLIGGKGIGIQGLSSNALHQLLFPIPPIEEQYRIVNKLKQLESLIDKYKQAEEKLFELNSNIKEQLKKSILQYAIEGKLVPQDPNDEPASILLERIRKEKEKLIVEGKIKKDKNESIIYRRDNSYYEKLGDQEKCIDDQIPFEIPDNWCWTRLGNIGETNIGLTYKPSDITDSSGTLVLRSSNIKNNNMCYLDNVYVSCSMPEKSQIHKNDLLICARNGSRSLVGKSAIFDREEAAFGAFMAKFCSDYNHYVKLFLDSPLFRLRLEGVKTETINQITQFNLKQQLLPFPPIREQQRIIEKIAEISNLFEL